MALLFAPRRRGEAKSAQQRLNWGHPLSHGLVFCAAMGEGGGRPYDLVDDAPAPLSGGLRWSTGKYGAELLGDNTNGFASFPNKARYNVVGPISACALFRIPAAGFTSWHQIVQKPFTTTNTSPFMDWGLAVLEFFGGYSVILAANGDTSGGGVISNPLGRWVHAVGTRDGTNIRIYLDGGAPTVTAQSNLPTNTNSQPVRIGANADAGEPWGGDIAFAAVWNRTLGGDEARALYAEPFGMLAPAPIRRFSSPTPSPFPLPRRKYSPAMASLIRR